SKKDLVFNAIKLGVDNHPFLFTGHFELGGEKPLYYLEIKSEKLLYQKGKTLVSGNIARRLDSFTVEKPIDVKAIIDGRLLPNRIPLVNIDVLFNGNSVSTKAGQFANVVCKANFTNQFDKLKPNNDENSGFQFTGFSGSLEGIPLRADSTSIVNLLHPELKTRILADFSLDKLNEMMSGSTIEILQGSCKADIRYKGLMIVGDTSSASVFGSIAITNASLRYIPRNLVLSDVKGSILLDNTDVWVKQLAVKSGSSEMVMNGEIRNFTSLIDKNPERLLLNWNIESSRLNLNDFISFVGKRSGLKTIAHSKRKTLRIFNQIDQMLNKCTVEVKISAQKATYKKFDATRVFAEARMTGNEIVLKKAQLDHAGGSMSFSGILKQLPGNNDFSFNADMRDVDVKKVFSSFNNFNQDGITDHNIEGKLTASSNISGSITDKAELVNNSLKGRVDLLLREGGLKKFEPLEKISRTAFKNRDFSDIHFADLKERLDINGSEIKLGKMEIQSSVMTMFVQGIYDLEKGTDISIQIPMSNLAKRNDSFTPRNKGINSRTGISLFLRAKSGEDGKTKVSWDPFKKALKNARRRADSLDISKKSAMPEP
ncbi:MAG: AsmA-like C-terminal region-containing protein, partial [Chitinophagaceae bacterium]